MSIWPALQRYTKRLARIAAQRWAPSLVFLVLATIVESSRSWAIQVQGSWQDLPSLYFFREDGALQVILGCSAAALGTALAAALPWIGWRSAIASIVITLTLVGGFLWLVDLLRNETPYQSVSIGLVLSNTAFTLRSFWSHSMAGLLFGAFCAAKEREAEMLAAARNAELERANAQRGLLESRLQILQAQIDPALLFDGLADVNRLYRQDTAAAVARLDELITYLRAALPKTRT